MARTIEDRIETLLDQLEDPNLSAGEVELIERKIELLRSQKE